MSGRVQVYDALTQPSERGIVVVSAGKAALIEPRSTLLAAKGTAAVETMTARRHQKIVFDKKPMSAVAEECNRYSRPPMRIDDPALGTKRIGGRSRSATVHSSSNCCALPTASARGAIRVRWS